MMHSFLYKWLQGPLNADFFPAVNKKIVQTIALLIALIFSPLNNRTVSNVNRLNWGKMIISAIQMFPLFQILYLKL